MIIPSVNLQKRSIVKITGILRNIQCLLLNHSGGYRWESGLPFATGFPEASKYLS